MFTDGSMLIALAIMAVLLLLIAMRKPLFSKTIINRAMRICVIVEFGVCIALGIFSLTNTLAYPLHFTLSVIDSLFGSGAIFYWLRRVRGSSRATSLIFVFSALFISEIVVYLGALTPPGVNYLISGCFVIVQFPCMLWARSRPQPYLVDGSILDTASPNFLQDQISNKWLLIVSSLAVCTMGIVTGFLRGYPDGMPITFTPTTRFLDFVLIQAICLGVLVLVVKGKLRLPVVSLWVLMQVLASGALILYALLPQSLDVGAVFTTCLNSIMVVYCWYVIIEFMGFGWRSPYYYCFAGWLVWLGSRSIARIVLLNLYPVDPNGPLVNALLSALLLLSAQMIFMQFLTTLLQEHTKQEAAFNKRSTLVKIMGLDGNQSFSDIRQVSMRRNSEEMGRQFMLSEREIDVLALYALGYTQRRVAEELCVSPGTAHAHIKHLYAKTGMHSRQEILDYMQNYTS